MGAVIAYVICVALSAPLVYWLCRMIERNEPRRERTVEVLSGYSTEEDA